MSNDISVFIMDISNSSEENAGIELSDYLQEVVDTLQKWTRKCGPIHVSHRAGDELVVISSGYATAYTLAFYISRVWQFPQHKPYFGLSFGTIDEEVNLLNIETWIHPLMKHARKANEFLKNQQDRGQFRFQLPSVSAERGFEVFNKQFETLINTSLNLKQEQMNEQTDIQSLVCSLYLIVSQQNKISEYLGRTTSTISSHMKNGKTDLILNTFYDIVNVLNALEKNNAEHRIEKLQKNIRQNIISSLPDYFPIERRSK